LKKATFNITLLFVFISISFSSYAQLPLNDTVECVHAIGVATENGVPLDGAIITIYQGNEVIEWSEITSDPKHDHHFNINLLGNNYYTIQVSKPGYVTRSVGINTKMPEDVVINEDNPKTKIEFEVDIFKIKKTANDELLDYPIALINYNEVKRKFEFDTEYTKKIKEKMGY
jgi:hypothetical protein